MLTHTHTHTHAQNKGICGTESPYHNANHGKLVSVMLLRSFVWWRFLHKGVSIVALDGDMGLKKNPLDYIDENRFMLEVLVCLLYLVCVTVCVWSNWLHLGCDTLILNLKKTFL